MRAGTFGLSLLAAPLNVHVLQALEEGPTSLIDLRRAVGSPPQTTMRGYLRTMTDLGVLERNREHGVPGQVDLALARPGIELLAVADVLATWLRSAPDGPLELGSVAAKGAIKAFVDGWCPALLRAFAARPLTLTELDGLITNLNYPSLERRVAALKLAGLIESSPAEGRGKPYAVTAWLRHAVAPLLAAALWERERLGNAVTPLARIDAEAIFLLTLPALDLTTTTDGTCRLVVEFAAAAPAGAQLVVREGQVVSCVSRLRGDTEAVVAGSSSAWLRAAVRDDPVDLEIRGDWALADAVIHAFRHFLFSAESARER